MRLYFLGLFSFSEKCIETKDVYNHEKRGLILKTCMEKYYFLWKRLRLDLIFPRLRTFFMFFSSVNVLLNTYDIDVVLNYVVANYVLVNCCCQRWKLLKCWYQEQCLIIVVVDSSLEVKTFKMLISGTILDLDLLLIYRFI